MDPISPVVERRSRRIGPVNNIDESVAPEDLNDDEEERTRNRKQLENDVRHNSIHEKRLSASEKSLSEHFQSCIQLAAENKINAKNAFNFKLIDLLHTMLSKKKQIHDFTEVTYSLDAGVKIYSYRVDNVHSDTMKMATSICSAANKNKTGTENETNETEGNLTQNDDFAKKKKQSKKSNKNVRATDVDQINRKAVDDQFGIPCGLLNNEDYIINSATFDSTKMCLHLVTNSNFWKNNYHPKATPSTTDVSVELPHLEDEIICPSFKDFTFKGESNYHDISMKEKLTHEYDFEPPTYEPADDDNFNDQLEEPYMNDLNDVNDISDEIDSKPNATSDDVCLSKVMSSSNFASDLSRLIASETSEYCYFNTQLLKKKWSLKSMGHWNPFVKKRETISRPRTQKKDLIDFFGNDDFKAFEDEAKIPFTVTYALNSDKFLITPITHFNFKEFFRLKTCREMFVVPNPSNEEQPSDFEENVNDYNYNNPNDSQNFIPEQYEDDYSENFDEGVVQDVHEAIDRSVLQGDNLIEIPNKVAKIQLPYLVKDKSVDMKELKSKIWQKIECTENEKPEVDHAELQFSDICQEIITNSKTELSVPLLFNAILQLANDRNLQFDSLQSNLSNFYIRIANVENL